MGSLEKDGRPAVDTVALADALRSLGMLYGAQHTFAATVAGAADEKAAIRKYIEHERAHLLATYDIDHLVSLVLEARASKAQSHNAIEQFNPR